MTDFEIRAMNPADIDAAVDLALAQGWRDRRAFYALTLRTRSCQPLVGVLDGRVVATGLATVSAPVGWLGAVIVDEAVRGRGFGRAMTEELRRMLRAAGCETLALVATAAGQPLYERMGFRVVTHYRQMEGDHLDAAPEAPEGARLRPLTTDDLPRVFELDRLATAEDRRAVLAELASAGGWVLESAADATAGLAADAAAGHATRPEAGGAAGLAAGTTASAAAGLAADAAGGLAARHEAGQAAGLRGFLLPSDRAYAAIVAPAFQDGLCLLELHRHLAPSGGHARAAIPEEHAAAWHELEARGWRHTWLAPRMQEGPDVPWHPTWIWSLINSAMG
jgi:ribosomal protein S18 acetylase RimI-like enzyme